MFILFKFDEQFEFDKFIRGIIFFLFEFEFWFGCCFLFDMVVILKCDRLGKFDVNILSFFVIFGGFFN